MSTRATTIEAGKQPTVNVVAPAESEADALASISYKFVRRLFVYDIIVGNGGLGRSPAPIGFANGRSLATLNGPDYDPSPAYGRTSPGPAVRCPSGQLVSLRTRTAKEEYPV